MREIDEVFLEFKEKTGISSSELRNPKRSPDIIAARRAFAHMCYLRRIKDSVVSDFVGLKDRSTIVHHRKIFISILLEPNMMDSYQEDANLIKRLGLIGKKRTKSPVILNDGDSVLYMGDVYIVNNFLIGKQN